MANLKKHLEARLGRPIAREELAVALGISISTFTRRQGAGFPAEDVIRAARALQLSPVDLLIDCGYVTRDEVLATASGSASLGSFSDVDLAQEILRRAEGGTSAVLTSPGGLARAASRTGEDDVAQADDYVLAALDRDDDAEAEAQQQEP